MEQENFWAGENTLRIKGFSLIFENKEDYVKFKKMNVLGCFQLELK